MNISQIRFDKEHNVEFYKTLQKRVRDYFKENNIDRYGNWNMKIKTIFMLSLYIVPLVLILTTLENNLAIVFMWMLMGLGMAGIGLSVMHDACHGAYSKRAWVNSVLGFTLNCLGGSDVTWRIQHNVLHHTYTNVTGMDEDIDPGKLMRFSPHAKRYKAHRFQHIYAWFFYGLMTISWITAKDFKQLARYKKLGLTKTQQKSYNHMMTVTIISKIMYYGVTLVLPLILSPMVWWGTVLCFIMLHFIAGLTLGCIFQPAHVVPSSDYPMPDDSGNIKADWAVNQLFNTANFAQKSKWFTWFVGGLNHQVEHHLFPNICHVHYTNLSHIVRKTAEEYNLPYNSQKTFFKALKVHGQMLKALGTQDEFERDFHL
ncbi:linoleoyl-CoA desaturase [Lishizhenia tianjinensis]|uniref:Linoleoyl-CoA desaturase n=1 Tax=Lishizhenia tianjinensis TaxID=477690 RepID=A0A1I6ZI59_9FLAO|nr:acyl-CoA desaturase [Lishizhenia tianjinensis]SFT62354.1 linoleoyl-CoA desaturase [Lishizhenia tianjinensis]